MVRGKGNLLLLKTGAIFQTNPHTQVAALEFKAAGHDFVLTFGINDVEMQGDMV